MQVKPEKPEGGAEEGRGEEEGVGDVLPLVECGEAATDPRPVYHIMDFDNRQHGPRA
jgi:hypothetical protein